MTQERERREFFRVHDHLLIEFRQISPDDFNRLKDAIQYSPAQAIEGINEVYSLKERKLKGGSDDVVACLQVINKKLDAIIDHLFKVQYGETYHPLQADVTISGAGLQFEYHLSLEEGSYVELRFVIPVLPYPRITALCEVVRSADVTGLAPGHYAVALKFLVINERDRDVLINYVFAKERERLRQQKETKS